MTAGSRKGPASYDMHLHTCWSYDGTAEPELYFKRARELGTRCLSFTEHHNIDSMKEVSRLAEKFPGIRAVPGAELSVSTSLCQVDLLCYNMPPEPEGELAAVIEKYRLWQDEAGRAVSEGMRKLGYGYTDGERQRLLESYRPERAIKKQGLTRVRESVQRGHFIERGYVSGAEEYGPLLKKACMPIYPPAEEIIPAVKEAGCLIVIAHPAWYFENDDVRRMDILRDECMLDGIECAHRKVPPELTLFYREYCLKHGMVSTGGSDCHFTEDVLTEPDEWGYTGLARFACHIGEDLWLDEFLERLG